uniref:[histone H3]-lysine(4) N-trimethyltransferase n=1 Tax=Takifugu rubripes TaxID=31033 RepID=A0A674NSQ3_TAKRU
MTVGNMESAELFDGGIKGRGLRATKEISTGEVVFAEPSYSAVVFDSFASQVCHSCFRHQAQLHRCGQCKFAHYCNRTCQTACWEEHKQECQAIRKLGTVPGDKVRLAARVMWRIHKDTGVASDSQLLSVEELEDHVADLPEDHLKRIDTDVHVFLQYWSCGRTKHSLDEIAHIFGIIKCNGFTLSDQRGLKAVGVGLFPNLCLVNHDCWPNCSVVLNHEQSHLTSCTERMRYNFYCPRRIELRALRKICEGEELTVSYVDFLDTSAERQRKLKEHFYFECTCEHCRQHIKDDLMTAAAADGPGGKPSADQVQEVTAFSQECLEKIERSLMDKDFQEVRMLCSKCLEKQKNLLADTHLHHLRVLSAAVEVLSYLRCFSEAAAYARRMVQGYTKLYHPNSAQLGIAVMRAGVTHLQAGMIEMAHELICKAYRILLVTHGPNHSVTRDLEAMRRQTEVELKLLKQDESACQVRSDAALKK